MRYLLVLLFAATSVAAQTPDGAQLFQQHCSQCHNGSAGSLAPGPDLLKQVSPESILVALVGPMRVPGSKLSGPERRAVAEYVTGKELGGDVLGVSTGRCPSQPPIADPSSTASWNGWSPDVTNTRFQSAKAAGLTAEQVPHLVLKWAFGYPDATISWATPTVVSERVFVGSHNGTVYSLNAKTGCVYWTFSAEGGVRAAPVIGDREGGEKPGARRLVVYFGDTNANEYALDAFTGEKLWIRKVDDHPFARITGSPTLYKGRLYVPTSSYEEAQSGLPEYECCTFRGSITVLDAKSGSVIWKAYTITDPPKRRGTSTAGAPLWGPSGAAIWSSPTIDAKRGMVYAATGNTYTGPDQPMSDAVVAFDIKTGKIAWSTRAVTYDVSNSGCSADSKNPNCPEVKGPDYDYGSSPMLAKKPDGHDVIVIGSKSGMGFAMDPDNKGKVLWKYKVGEGGSLGGIEWGSAVAGDTVYFPLSDIRRPKPGGLHAVNLTTGERIWYAPPPPLKCSGTDCNAAQSAAITVIPGVVFSGSNDGALRAYSTADGSIIWEYDTNREFQTVNGIPGKGASMIGPGPTVVGGMVYVNSGYGGFGGRPGNVLLAFGLE